MTCRLRVTLILNVSQPPNLYTESPGSTYLYTYLESSSHIYISTLRGQIKGAVSAISVIQHSLCGGTRNTARHVIMVIVLAFLTQENKAGKMQSTINQLIYGKGRAVRDNGTRGVVSIDHTARTIIARTALPSVL